MAWSIFTQGGGDGAAVTWADDLLQAIGAPLTPGNEQFVFDWETSEGGGGAYNPLNQGPVPGHPELTTTGQQYGGGAADFAGWQAGLTGAADYLAMGAYQGITRSLMASDPAGARSALIASPWASSHYGDGADFSDAPLPGKASALGPDTGSGSVSLGLNPLDWPGQIASGAASSLLGPIEQAAILIPILLGAAAIGAAGLIQMTRAPRQQLTARTEQRASQAAELAAVAA